MKVTTVGCDLLMVNRFIGNLSSFAARFGSLGCANCFPDTSKVLRHRHIHLRIRCHPHTRRLWAP